MNIPQPGSFIEFAFAILAVIGILFTALSLIESKRAHATRMLGIYSILALAVISKSFGTYFAAIFIIGTLVTELDFLHTLAAIIRGDKSYFAYKKAVQGQTTPETPLSPATKSKSKRTLMEYMILNTLWTKQVNKWPDLSLIFTFRMNFSAQSEQQAFREAGAKLIGEGLIMETTDGQYGLTISGFEYCKQHYKEFPSEQWWPEEKINEDNLKKVLGMKVAK